MKIAFLSALSPAFISEGEKPLLMHKLWHECEALGLSPVWVSYDDESLPKVDIVFPFYAGDEVRAEGWISRFKNAGVKVLFTKPGWVGNKWEMGKILEENQISYPFTVPFKGKASLNEIPFPSVLKPNKGRGGEGMFWLNSEADLPENLPEPSYILQKAILPAGVDFRAFVVGEKVVAVMKRFAPEGDWRTNYTLHGLAEKSDLPETVKAMAVQSTKVLGLLYGGVDLMRDESGAWFVLEVNARPGLGIEGVTGVNVAKEILAAVLSQ